MTGAVTLNDDSVVLFNNGSLGIYGASTSFKLNEIIFDCASQTYQQAIVSGVSGATTPTFSKTVGAITVDGSVTWVSLDPPLVITISNLPPSPPNVPPAPPQAPTGLMVDSES
jgi:hypothetical protein